MRTQTSRSEDHGNALATTNPHADRRTPARAPLAVRVALVLLAVAALAVAGVAGVNLHAVIRFNQATASLNENLSAASKDGADLDALGAGQQQTDAQFSDAGALGFLLLPQVRRSISHNAEVSTRLTDRTVKELAKQKDGTDADQASDPDRTDAGAAATGSSGSAKQGDGLTEQQRRQVEELLKANQQSTPSDSVTKQQKDTGDKDTGSTTAKPW